MTSLDLFRTPFYVIHTALNARMVPFSGWEMPVQYVGIGKEHQAVRQQAGLFDISHMGKFLLQGQDLLQQLQRLVPSDLSRLKAGEAQYTVLLNPAAGIIDDLIIYYQGLDESGEQRVMTIVNAATLSKDKDWLLAPGAAGRGDLTGSRTGRFVYHSPLWSLRSNPPRQTCFFGENRLHGRRRL
jgi:aminomethyltransferase